MDRVERKITKRHEIESRNRKFAERFHEFATLGDYKEAMINSYRKTEESQRNDDESSKPR